MSISAALSIARQYKNGGTVVNVGHKQLPIKKRINFQGLQISIENPKGSIRSGISDDGKPWSNRMHADYGYIKCTEGKDGDQVDVFVGPNRKSDRVFIIDQLHHHMEKFDEHKCLLGFNTKKQALTAYHRSYGRVYGHHHTVGAVTELSIDAFKEWLKGGGGKEPIAPDVPKYKRGGAAKATKETANYRLGTKAEHCAKCSMFREPDSCTAVEGKIRPQDTCNYFEPKKMATGGKIRKYTMPLKKGSSKATISQNIREFHTGPTFAHTAAKFGKKRAQAQAIAAALSSARKSAKKKAFGGPNIESMIQRGSAYALRREGMINSTIPGRTDKHPMNVPVGSYVLPSDIPSALGQGNTMAGGAILNKMFSTGPYGMPTMRGVARGPRPPRLNLTPRMRQEGGKTDSEDSHVPIIAAGGEFLIPPEVVREVGHGNITAGHRVLDAFVLRVRKKNVDTLKNLPGPKK